MVDRETSTIVQFVVLGPPATVTWKARGGKPARNYQAWVQLVGQVAKAALPLEYELIPANDRGIEATINHFFTNVPSISDLDNLIKPTLDGLGSTADQTKEQVIWEDDQVVDRIIAERFDLANGLVAISAEPVVAQAIRNQAEEFIYVRIARND